MRDDPPPTHPSTYSPIPFFFFTTKNDNNDDATTTQVLEAKVRQQPDGSLIAEFGGSVHTIYALEEPLGLRMVLDGVTVLLPTVYDPSELRTDVTGKIVRCVLLLLLPGCAGVSALGRAGRWKTNGWGVCVCVCVCGEKMTGSGTPPPMAQPLPPSLLPFHITQHTNYRYLQEDGAEIQAGQPYVEVEAMKMIMPLKAQESGTVSHRLSPGSIITAGDLLANIQLKDPSKVKKITPFKGQLSLEAGPVGEEAAGDTAGVLKTMNLVLDGYDYEVELLAQALVAKSQSAGDLVEAASALLTKYLAVEEQFAGKVLDEAMVGLVKANKDSLATVLALATAHRELPRRNKVRPSCRLSFIYYCFMPGYEID
jgi:hypothetical protein